MCDLHSYFSNLLTDNHIQRGTPLQKTSILTQSNKSNINLK